MSHENRSWAKRWSLDEAGTRVTHQNGLVATWDGRTATLDPEAARILAEKITAEDGTDKHVGGKLHKLLDQADQIFKKRHYP